MPCFSLLYALTILFACYLGSNLIFFCPGINSVDIPSLLVGAVVLGEPKIITFL